MRGTHIPTIVCMCYVVSLSFSFGSIPLYACTLFIISYLKRHVFNCTNRDSARARQGELFSPMCYNDHKIHTLHKHTYTIGVLFCCVSFHFEILLFFSLRFGSFRCRAFNSKQAARCVSLCMHVYSTGEGAEYIRSAGFWYTII